MKKLSIVFFCFFLVGCGSKNASNTVDVSKTGNVIPSVQTGKNLLVSHNTSMLIETDFLNNGNIPSQYTCDGAGLFPTLNVKDIPANAKTLALIVEDPDAPIGNRDHYLMANIPVSGTTLSITTELENSSTVGKNSRGRTNRGGPCPPNGTHRYFFKVYALDNMIDLQKGFVKNELLDLIDKHLVQKTEIVGLYAKK